VNTLPDIYSNEKMLGTNIKEETQEHISFEMQSFFKSHFLQHNHINMSGHALIFTWFSQTLWKDVTTWLT